MPTSDSPEQDTRSGRRIASNDRVPTSTSTHGRTRTPLRNESRPDDAESDDASRAHSSYGAGSMTVIPELPRADDYHRQHEYSSRNSLPSKGSLNRQPGGSSSRGSSSLDLEDPSVAETELGPSIGTTPSVAQWLDEANSDYGPDSMRITGPRVPHNTTQRFPDISPEAAYAPPFSLTETQPVEYRGGSPFESLRVRSVLRHPRGKSDMDRSSNFPSLINEGLQAHRPSAELDLARNRIGSRVKLESPIDEAAYVGSTSDNVLSYNTDESRAQNMLSIKSAPEPVTIDHQSLLALALKAAASRLLFDYTNNIQRGTGPHNEPITANSSVGENETSKDCLPQSQPRSTKKRSTSQGDGDDSDEGASGRRPSKKQRVTNTKLFCCPFWKLRPAEHRPCFKHILRRIRDVKQHLHRKHTPSYYCERCSETFPDDTKLREHISNPAGLFCTPSSSLRGVSRSQRLQLARHSDKELSAEDQWFSIWDVLFPGYKRPQSVYMDTEVSEDIHLFRDFCRGHGEAILAEEIKTAGLLNSVKGNEKQLFSTVFAQAMNTLFDDWVSGRKGSRHKTTSNDCKSQSGSIVPGESQDSLVFTQDLSGNFPTSRGVEVETNPVLSPHHQGERPIVNYEQFPFETADWGDLSTTFMFSSNGEADMELPSMFGDLI